jgi:hypothetical protein
MQIRYHVTKDIREVDDAVGLTLIGRNLAERVVVAEEPLAIAPKPRPSRTPSRKRGGRYQRRDMRAVD